MGRRRTSTNLNVFSLDSPRGSRGPAGAPAVDRASSPERGPCGGVDLEALDV